jgi:hypothetical protein
VTAVSRSTVRATSRALNDARSERIISDARKGFALLDKVSLASHRCNGNFGEGCVTRRAFLEIEADSQEEAREKVQELLQESALEGWEEDLLGVTIEELPKESA